MLHPQLVIFGLTIGVGGGGWICYVAWRMNCKGQQGHVRLGWSKQTNKQKTRKQTDKVLVFLVGWFKPNRKGWVLRSGAVAIPTPKRGWLLARSLNTISTQPSSPGESSVLKFVLRSTVMLIIWRFWKKWFYKIKASSQLSSAAGWHNTTPGSKQNRKSNEL